MNKKAPRWLLAFLSGACALTVLIFIFGTVGINAPWLPGGAPIPGPTPQVEQALVLASAQLPGNPNQSGPVYRYSVIPGGVRQSSELTSVLERDQLARVHYASFNSDNAYLVHVKSPRQVYVSYRMGNKIYWTKNKVWLSTGEALLTDGKSSVRTRCGNRISDRPQSTVSDKEPAPEELDMVIAPSPGAYNRTADASNNYVRPTAPTNNAGSVGAPMGAAAPIMQRPTPLPAPRTPPIAAPRPSPPIAQQPPGTPIGITPVLPPVAAFPVPVTPPELSTPPTSNRPPRPIPTSPIHDNVHVGEPILPAFPSPLPTVLPPPVIVVPEEPGTQVPEPASFTIVMLALVSLTLLRMPNRQKRRKVLAAG